MANTFSVIIPIHQISVRGRDRLKWQLLSLSLQTRKPSRVLIPDSSELAQFVQNTEVAAMGINWGLDVFHFGVDVPEGFNMPKLFNRALERVDTDYVLCTGVDFLYSPKYFEAYANAEKPGNFILNEVEMLPNKMITEKMVRSWTFPRTKPNPARKGADGIQYAHIDFFREIGGYDERMSGFGGMDNDMHNRARKHGMKCIWMKRHPARCLHQYHPSQKRDNDPQSLRNWKIRDDENEPIIRNFLKK